MSITNSFNYADAARSDTEVAKNSGSKSDRSMLQLGKDKDAWMKLLFAQVKNQDPTNPMDTNEMTQQIVAFSGLEQAVQTNANLEKLVALNQNAEFSYISGLIGKEITYDATQFDLEQGKPGTLNYTLIPANDKDGKPLVSVHTQIDIINQDNVIVRTIEGSNFTGENNIIWDGKDSLDKECPSGSYTIRVRSKDKNGRMVPIGSPLKNGLVTGADIVNGSAILNVNGQKVPLSVVRKINHSEKNDLGYKFD